MTITPSVIYELSKAFPNNGKFSISDNGTKIYLNRDRIAHFNEKCCVVEYKNVAEILFNHTDLPIVYNGDNLEVKPPPSKIVTQIKYKYPIKLYLLILLITNVLCFVWGITSYHDVQKFLLGTSKLIFDYYGI